MTTPQKASASMKIQAAATWVVTTAQKALNLAMSSNPIGIVIKVVAAAALALYGLYQTCEPVRVAVDTVITAIKDAFWGVVKTVASVYDKVSGWFGGSGTAVADLEAYLAKTEDVAKATAAMPSVPPTTAALAADPEIPGLAVAPAAVAVSAEATAPATTPAPARGAKAAPVSASAAPMPETGGGMSLAPQISFSINFAGVPSQDVGTVLVGAIKAKEREVASYFEKMLEGIASNQRRLAYDQ